MPNDTKFTSETARAAGKKSAEHRGRRKTPNEKAREALLKGMSAAAGVIVDVMSAESGFEDVRPELRFQAAKIVLEYTLGKPRGLSDESDTEKEEGPETGEDLFAQLLTESTDALDG